MTDFTECPFRIQVILSTLSGKVLKYKKIRCNEDEPGLRGKTNLI
jgi:RNA 3'-terminal phosphate cyclase